EALPVGLPAQVHRPRGPWPDVAQVPRLVGVARDVLAALRVADDEAEAVGVGGHPATVLAVAEAVEAAALPRDVDGQPELVLAVPRPGRHLVGALGPQAAHPVLVRAGLGVVVAEAGDHR